MNIVTVWGISDMIRYQNSGLVYEIRYTVTSTFEDFTYNDYGAVTVTRNSNSPDFIPYDNLTEIIVVEWVKDALGPSEVASIENNQNIVLQNMINISQNPSVEGVPW